MSPRAPWPARRSPGALRRRASIVFNAPSAKNPRERTVGRPERECGAVGVGQWASLEAVQRTHPETNRFGPYLREKRHLSAVLVK